MEKMGLYEYLKNGYVDAFTGFQTLWSRLARTKVINTPIQCDSGHINLWLMLLTCLSRIAKDGYTRKVVSANP